MFFETTDNQLIHIQDNHIIFEKSALFKDLLQEHDPNSKDCIRIQYTSTVFNQMISFATTPRGCVFHMNRATVVELANLANWANYPDLIHACLYEIYCVIKTTHNVDDIRSILNLNGDFHTISQSDIQAKNVWIIN